MKEATKSRTTAKVYIVVTIGYEFVSQSQRDSFSQAIKGDLNNPKVIVDYLKKNPSEAAKLIWKLNQDNISLYAISPTVDFADEIYKKLVSFLEGQQEGKITRVAVPGVIAGQITLLSGQSLPTIVPNLKGMIPWSRKDLLRAVNKVQGKKEDEPNERVTNYLDRIYYRFNNPGLSSKDRVFNYFGANTLVITPIIQKTAEQKLHLHSIKVTNSLNLYNYDVKLIFFNPDLYPKETKQIYTLTIDVTDVLPIIIGNVRISNEE